MSGREKSVTACLTKKRRRPQPIRSPKRIVATRRRVGPQQAEGTVRDALWSTSERLLERLQRLSEDELRDTVVRPLLDRLGFERVELRHGATERGVDLLCTKLDEIGDLDLLAIQLKKVQFTGNAAKTGHLHALTTQLSQCLEEPIQLSDGTARSPTRVWLVSPYPLTGPAIGASFARLGTSRASGITLVDGPKLVHLIRTKAPELLASLGDRLAAYMAKLERDLSSLPHASTLKITRHTSVLTVYVHLDSSLLPPSIIAFLAGPLQPVPAFGSLPASERHALTRRLHASLGIPLVQSKLEEQLADVQSQVRRRVGDETKKIRTALRRERIAEFVSVLKRMPGVTGDLEENVVRPLSRVTRVGSQSRRARATDDARLPIGAQAILDSRLNFQVVGSAGAGKTTLLRLLAHTEVTSARRIPLYLPLAAVRSGGTVRSFAVAETLRHELAGSEAEASALFESGSAVVLFDGIDEAVDRVDGLREDLRAFAAAHPNTQCIAATRPWAKFDNPGTWITLQVCPLTPEQLRKFFDTWFAAKPEHARRIRAHLERHSHLYELIATPLLASLLAVIEEQGGELPDSLIGLHEERLRLLLHDWDAAKGVARDVYLPQDKRFFLRRLAFALHRDGVRSTTWRELHRMAREWIGAARKSSEDCERFLRELVQNNNVLLQMAPDEWGLGHLEFQEYLAAVEARENTRIRLSEFLLSGWWAGVLRTHARLTRDVSGVVSEVSAENADLGEIAEGDGTNPEVQQLPAQAMIRALTGRKVAGTVGQAARSVRPSSAVIRKVGSNRSRDMVSGRGADEEEISHVLGLIGSSEIGRQDAKMLVLRRLLPLAPNTEQRAREQVEARCEMLQTIARSFQRRPD